MVDRDDENRDWSAVQMWTSGSGADQRHLYRFSTVSVGTEGGAPFTAFSERWTLTSQIPS
jgi:hypothetical protein